jgi:hypothetical protein
MVYVRTEALSISTTLQRLFVVLDAPGADSGGCDVLCSCSTLLEQIPRPWGDGYL